MERLRDAVGHGAAVGVAVRAAAVLTALVAVAACGPGDEGEPAAGATRPSASAKSATCAPPDEAVAPSSGELESSGIVFVDLPDEVRCLPGVAYGTLMESPSDPLGSGGPGRQLSVSPVEGTTREQSLELCRRLTGLGYGPGGRHGITMLAVSGDLTAGTYISGRPGQVCVKAY